MITGEDEMAMCNSNLIRKKQIADYIIKNIVVDPIVPIDDWMAMDVEALLLNIRIMNYGRILKFQWTCSRCDNVNKEEIDMGAFSQNPMIPSLSNDKTLCLHPHHEMGKILCFRAPTWKDKLAAGESLVSMLNRILVEVPGNEDILKKTDIDLLTAKQSAAFRKILAKGLPRFDSQINATCKQCGSVVHQPIEIDQDIFGYEPKTKSDIMTQMFELCYYGGGGFNISEVERMETTKRSFFYGKLIDAKKKEEEAAKGNEKAPPKIAKAPAVK
jgi:hypothetical protein